MPGTTVVRPIVDYYDSDHLYSYAWLSSKLSNNMRVDQALVVDIKCPETEKKTSYCQSCYATETPIRYIKDHIVKANLSMDPRVVMTEGIHVFGTKQEVKDY